MEKVGVRKLSEHSSPAPSVLYLYFLPCSPWALIEGNISAPSNAQRLSSLFSFSRCLPPLILSFFFFLPPITTCADLFLRIPGRTTFIGSLVPSFFSCHKSQVLFFLSACLLISPALQDQVTQGQLPHLLRD